MIGTTLSDRAAVSNEGIKVDTRGGVGIEHDGGPLEPGRDLREQLKPLASQRGFKVGEAGDVPTGWLSRSTMPLATGSPTFAKTIGIVRVSRWTGHD
jgi:hypothetical protein